MLNQLDIVSSQFYCVFSAKSMHKSQYFPEKKIEINFSQKKNVFVGMADDKAQNMVAKISY